VQTVRRLQSTPTSANLSPSLPPSLPPLFFSHSKPKPKKQATVDYSPPTLPLSAAQKREIGRDFQTLTAIHNITRTEANCVQENQGKNNSLARSLALAQQHPRNTHARTHSRRRAQRRTRETVTGRAGRRGLGLPDSAG